LGKECLLVEGLEIVSERESEKNEGLSENEELRDCDPLLQTN
jgi:hypothetical protein